MLQISQKLFNSPANGETPQEITMMQATQCDLSGSTVNVSNYMNNCILNNKV